MFWEGLEVEGGAGQKGKGPPGRALRGQRGGGGSASSRFWRPRRGGSSLLEQSGLRFFPDRGPEPELGALGESGLVLQQ